MPKAKTKAVSTAPLAIAPVTQDDVKTELLAVWDGDSPLDLPTIGHWYDKGSSLQDIGISDDEAATYVNKYNSIIARVPGRGPLVRSKEAAGWADVAMSNIVAEVFKRATR